MLDKIKALLQPNLDVSVKLTGISLFLGKSLDSFNDRIFSLEQRQLQKGDKGDKGDSIKGDKGDKGDAGKDGIGIAGKDGKDGKAGKDGKDGVSVVNSYIAADDSLVLVLSNGKEIDAGSISDSKSDFRTVINTQVSNQPVIEILSIATKTSDYTIQSTDYSILANSNSAPITISLPALPANGQVFHVKKIDATTNAVTVDGSGNLIDGESSWVINKQYNNMMIQYDVTSTTWNIL